MGSMYQQFKIVFNAFVVLHMDLKVRLLKAIAIRVAQPILLKYVVVGVGTAFYTYPAIKTLKKLLGCFATPVEIDNGVTYDSTEGLGNSVTGCQAAMIDEGYKFAGLLNGDSCFGMNTFVVKDYTKIASSNCEIPCRGDSSQFCGGSSGFSVYQLHA